MKRFAILLLVLVGIVTAQTPQAPKAHIEGVVLDGLTGNPVAGAALSALGIAPNTLTDAQGHFSADMNSGSTIVNFVKTGYRPARVEGRKLPNNVGIPLNLTPGQQKSDLVIRLFPQSVVTGKVFDQRGQPMQDAEIQAFGYMYNDAGVRHITRISSTTKTNDLGDFRMENLDPGEYFFEMHPASPDLGGTSGMFLPTLYYPGTTDISKAEPVKVEPGARVQLKNLTALAVRGSSVKVKLSNQAGEARGATILSLWRESDTSATLRSQFVQKDAMAEAVDLGRYAPGRYFVRAGFAGVNGGTNEGRITIDVSGNDTELNIPIVTFKPWNFVGRAVVEGPGGETKPAQGIQVAFYGVGPDALSSNFRANSILLMPVTSQADGTFPGRTLNPSMPPYAFHYRVVNPPAGMYVSAIRGVDSMRELKSNYGGTTDMTVVLGQNAGTITGTVTDAKGVGISFGNVVLLPDNATELHRLVTATTDGDGKFQIQAGPGAYHLYAWRELLGAPYINVEYMQKRRDSGVAVRVELGGRATVNAKVLED